VNASLAFIEGAKSVHFEGGETILNRRRQIKLKTIATA